MRWTCTVAEVVVWYPRAYTDLRRMRSETDTAFRSNNQDAAEKSRYRISDNGGDDMKLSEELLTERKSLGQAARNDDSEGIHTLNGWNDAMDRAAELAEQYEAEVEAREARVLAAIEELKSHSREEIIDCFATGRQSPAVVCMLKIEAALRGEGEEKP